MTDWQTARRTPDMLRLENLERVVFLIIQNATHDADCDPAECTCWIGSAVEALVAGIDNWKSDVSRAND